MKRKTFIAILAIAMVLVLSLAVLTACNNKKHDFSSKWEYDETSHWHECMTKKHSDVADKADHTFDAGIVTTPPTEDAAGVKTLTCTVCGYQKTESVPQLGHTFDMDNWKYDDTKHWHPATCAHTDLKKDEAEHTWNEGVVTTEPTETTEGVKTYTCTVCHNTKTAKIGTLEHKHTFDTGRWEYNAENHWHPASCGHTDEKKDLGAHVWNEGVVTTEPTETTDGVKTYTCTTCGNTKTATIGKLDHEHTFDMTKWSYDTENHWHPATCAHTDEKKDLAAHNWNAGVITKPADYGVEGEKTFTCTVCKATKIEPIDALDAKDNEIVLKEGKTFGKEYDGEVVSITKDDFVIEGNREIAFMFKAKGADDNTYAATAPKKAGEYTVKVSVAATAEWKAATQTFDFEIIKADIVDFTISNADAFNNIFVGATNIPDPTTNYVEIGTGYGAKTIVWEQKLEGGVWSRNLTKEEVIQLKTGTFRVHIKYAEGDNYKFGDAFVEFTMKAKPRRLTVKSFSGKMYDGKPVANLTFNNLVKKFGATSHDGVENITSATESGEKYLEYRKKGDTLWTKVTDVAIPKNAAEYEYRIGVTATDEWEAVVSEVNTFTIKPYEFVLDLGYVENQHNSSSDGGKTFKLRTFSAKNGNELIEGQVIELWLNNEKAGFNTSGSHFVPDQKKKVKTGCFFLKISNFVSANMENYKIVTKSSSVTTVEITVVESLTGATKSTTGKIQAFNEAEKWISTTVEKGYFKVGQTVIVYNSAGTILGEAKITEIKVGSTTSASGCAIPSDGLVTITLDKVFSGMTYGKLVAK